jgi:hypothetical protein
MKKMSYSLIALGLLATSAMALDMTDYKPTDSFFDEAYVNAQFALEDGNQDQTSYNGVFGGNYQARKFTLPYAWNIRANAEADISRGEDANSSTESNYEVTVDGNFDKYFSNTEDFFYYGSAELAYADKYLKVDENNASISTMVDAENPYVKVGAGIGYGRVYNATSLAKALRIAEDFKQYNIITKEINDDTMMKLAQLIELEPEYYSKYGPVEYKKYFFEAIEKVLKDGDVLEKDGALGAFGVVRIEEILFEERVAARYHGWLVRAGLGKIMSSYDGTTNDPTVDLAFEYGLPIGYKLQFYNIAKYSTLMVGDSDKETGHLFTNNMSLTYEITNMIDWENAWNYRYDNSSVKDVKDITTNSLDSTFRYYLTNRLNFYTTVSLLKVDDGYTYNPANANSRNDDLETRVFTGLQYRLK